jgi:hypothetical protein
MGKPVEKPRPRLEVAEMDSTSEEESDDDDGSSVDKVSPLFPTPRKLGKPAQKPRPRPEVAETDSTSEDGSDGSEDSFGDEVRAAELKQRLVQPKTNSARINRSFGNGSERGKYSSSYEVSVAAKLKRRWAQAKIKEQRRKRQELERELQEQRRRVKERLMLS